MRGLPPAMMHSNALPVRTASTLIDERALAYIWERNALLRARGVIRLPRDKISCTVRFGCTDVPALLPCALLPRQARGTHKKQLTNPHSIWGVLSLST